VPRLEQRVDRRAAHVEVGLLTFVEQFFGERQEQLVLLLGMLELRTGVRLGELREALRTPRLAGHHLCEGPANALEAARLCAVLGEQLAHVPRQPPGAQERDKQHLLLLALVRLVDEQLEEAQQVAGRAEVERLAALDVVRQRREAPAGPAHQCMFPSKSLYESSHGSTRLSKGGRAWSTLFQTPDRHRAHGGPMGRAAQIRPSSPLETSPTARAPNAPR